MILTCARPFRCHGRILTRYQDRRMLVHLISLTWWRVSPPVGGHGPGQNSPSIEGGSMQPHELPPPVRMVELLGGFRIFSRGRL